MINISEIILIRGELENEIFNITNKLLNILGNNNLFISQNQIQELLNLEDKSVTLNLIIDFSIKKCSYTIVKGNLEKKENEKILQEILKNQINVHAYYYGSTFNPIGINNEKWIDKNIDEYDIIRLILSDLDIVGY